MAAGSHSPAGSPGLEAGSTDPGCFACVTSPASLVLGSQARDRPCLRIIGSSWTGGARAAELMEPSGWECSAHADVLLLLSLRQHSLPSA